MWEKFSVCHPLLTKHTKRKMKFESVSSKLKLKMENYRASETEKWDDFDVDDERVDEHATQCDSEFGVVVWRWENTLKNCRQCENCLPLQRQDWVSHFSMEWKSRKSVWMRKLRRVFLLWRMRAIYCKRRKASRFGFQIFHAELTAAVSKSCAAHMPPKCLDLKCFRFWVNTHCGK